MFSPFGINHLTTHSNNKNNIRYHLLCAENVPQHYVFIKLKINYACLRRSLKALKDKATKVYSQQLF